MSDKSGIMSIIENPIIILVFIAIIFISLFSVFKGSGSNVVSTYTENENWKNSTNIKGPENAPVSIIEYGDYQCSPCGMAAGIVKQILDEYKDKVKLEYRHFPLPMHGFATNAAIAAECTGEQGKFWEMHDMLFENQKDINSKENLKKFAGEIGLDTEKFNACFDNSGYIDKININKSQGEADNVSGTPTFIINGQKLKSFQLESFKSRIDEELDKVK